MTNIAIQKAETMREPTK